MKSIIVRGVRKAIYTDTDVFTYLQTGFKQPIKHGTISTFNNIVIHENAGSAEAGTVASNFKKYGYTLCIDWRGDVYQYCDLSDYIYHGGQINGVSIGLCVLNRYYPKGAVGERVIPAEWWTHCSPKNDRRYLKPTDVQIETVKVIVPQLCRLLNIPYEFPTAHLGPKQRKIKGWWRRAKPGPGVVAHGDYSGHADGRYILERLIENQNEVPEVETCGECGRAL